jgi:hypothetical protein
MRTLKKYLPLAAVTLCLALMVPNAQASPPIGVMVQNWHYDPVTKQLSIHVVNISNKDVTGYNMSVTVKYANGTSAFSEMTEDFLPLMASFNNEELRRQYGNGTFAAGTSRDQVVPQSQDVRDVTATVDVVVYANTADVENSRAFGHLMATRKGMLLATQQADEVLKQALASPNPNAAAAKELTRLADVSKGRGGSPNDPESQMEFALRGLASRAATSDLTQLIKDDEARIAFYAPHVQLVKGRQQ